ncbi:TPA: nitrogen fixation protein NifR [Staphylococcus aureus]|nr:nitrogen fixation protein NifR [Staphylococcus aureus]MSN55717.1 nitrogen fixation protein NifR [Staphylococcus aureus]MSN62171.1 nitrogen fixation protein NifR [Staphylococcus aureus]MSN64645.1 nitrogen fixation protein NifR [Staphylococcus aureus]MSN69781.1 nitrogen fixation protein NifR [Staphylococcus aureus]
MKFSEHTSMHVGVGRRNKFCENIISVPLPIKKQP